MAFLKASTVSLLVLALSQSTAGAALPSEGFALSTSLMGRNVDTMLIETRDFENSLDAREARRGGGRRPNTQTYEAPPKDHSNRYEFASTVVQTAPQFVPGQESSSQPAGSKRDLIDREARGGGKNRGPPRNNDQQQNQQQAQQRLQMQQQQQQQQQAKQQANHGSLEGREARRGKGRTQPQTNRQQPQPPKDHSGRYQLAGEIVQTAPQFIPQNGGQGQTSPQPGRRSLEDREARRGKGRTQPQNNRQQQNQQPQPPKDHSNRYQLAGDIVQTAPQLIPQNGGQGQPQPGRRSLEDREARRGRGRTQPQNNRQQQNQQPQPPKDHSGRYQLAGEIVQTVPQVIPQNGGQAQRRSLTLAQLERRHGSLLAAHLEGRSAAMSAMTARSPVRKNKSQHRPHRQHNQENNRWSQNNWQQNRNKYQDSKVNLPVDMKVSPPVPGTPSPVAAPPATTSAAVEPAAAPVAPPADAAPARRWYQFWT